MKYFETYNVGENTGGNYSGVIRKFINDMMKIKTSDIQWRKAEKVFDVMLKILQDHHYLNRSMELLEYDTTLE
ncbi:MAG: hypothetical protein QXU98_12020 [Candidatus Parvarchaeota archaeon]